MHLSIVKIFNYNTESKLALKVIRSMYSESLAAVSLADWPILIWAPVSNASHFTFINLFNINTNQNVAQNNVNLCICDSLYLDGVQGQLDHSTLLRCERFGLLANHVLLKTTMRCTNSLTISFCIVFHAIRALSMLVYRALTLLFKPGVNSQVHRIQTSFVSEFNQCAQHWVNLIRQCSAASVPSSLK